MSWRWQAVAGLEQLGEDGVVEGLRAQQADGQGEAPGHLARLAGGHHRRGRGLAAHADQGDPLGPALDGLGVGHAGWPSRCSASRRWPAPRPGSRATAGTAFQVRAVALEGRDQGGVDHVVLEGADRAGPRRTRRPGRRRAPRGRWPGPARCRRRRPTPRRRCARGRRGAGRSRAPRCESAGRPGCTGCSPSPRGCSSSAPPVGLDVERLVAAVGVVVAEDVVGADDHAGRAAGAQARGHDLV